jgi:hypothetical protein
LAELNARQDLVTVLFSPKNLALPWQQALRAVLDAAPKALPILCHSFAEVIDWPQVAEAGAYYSLLMPFNVSEFRQSLGFVRSARQRHGDATVRFDATHRDLGDITHLHSAVIAQTREAARP